jgi:polyribonucleotide nucleotidyltransferase
MEHQMFLNVPLGLLGLIIGKGGQTIQSISIETGARISIGKTRPSVTICGAVPEQVIDAASRIKVRGN